MTSKKEKPWKLCHISEFDFFAPLLTKANRGAHPCAPPYKFTPNYTILNRVVQAKKYAVPSVFKLEFKPQSIPRG
jgi:hypothetical protein